MTNQPRQEDALGAIRPASEIQGMFDRIVGRYDLMNRVMTGGRDVAWRRQAASIAIGSGAENALDVATGTGDLAFELHHQGVSCVTGLDFAREMIGQADVKRRERNLESVSLLQGDAMKLPFADSTFDAVTIAWGLRNLPDYAQGIAEMARVLKKEGRLVVLEMTPLRQPLLRRAFNLYFERVVPIIGGIVSGDYDAYRYLPASVGKFPNAPALAEMMREAGLRNVRYILYGGGTVALHIGVKD